VKETVAMKDKATGRARGFGFVIFVDPEAADRVAQEKHTIDGRQVGALGSVQPSSILFPPGGQR